MDLKYVQGRDQEALFIGCQQPLQKVGPPTMKLCGSSDRWAARSPGAADSMDLQPEMDETRSLVSYMDSHNQHS